MTPGPAPTPASLPVGRSVQGTGKCGEGPQLPYLMTPRSSMSITNTKGLLNMPGQNNCFLNSAVQVLWHLDIFRRSFRELSGHACMAESCIFCALKELFAQFQYSQESALPPDALRRALAETFCDQRRFQLGFMDDAAECFENILMRIHFHIANQESEDMCSASHCIPHQKFAMTLVEQTVCHACGATSEPLPFTQMVHYVPSSALCSQAKLMRGKSDEVPGFGELLRRAGGLGDLRDCPSACGAVIQIRKTLMNRPEIVSVGLVWDSERPTIEHIMDVFNTIGMSLKLQDVFHSVVDSRWASTATHQLVGIVTYYGKHYSTFFFHTKLRVWIYFDDAAVREIGPKWEQVVEKCCRGHFQPLLLLYANPYGTSVCTSTAPRTVTVVPGHKKTSNGKDTFGRNLVTEKVVRNHIPSNNQRRALTPNPEVSYDLSATVQPRRAVTPSGEISRIEDGEHQNGVNHDAKGESLISRKAYDSSAYSQHISNDLYQELCNKSYEPSVYFTHNHELHHLQQTDSMKNGKNSSQEKLGVPMSNVRSSVPSAQEQFSSEANDIKNFVCAKNCFSTRPASVDDLLHSSTLARLMGSECARFIVNGVTDDGCFDGRSLGYRDDHGTESTYISRKAVENVLHLQKLQRQKSINAKHGHIVVGQRNSSSSLESLENMFLLREKGFGNFLGLKLDIPDVSNMPRRRDSGNWSGDRNSASSSSTTSLDNPYFYIVGNKRSFNNPNRNIGKTGAPDFNAFTDPGYDSFSLSSSDSYPSTVTNSPGKLDPRLGQIPENVQTAFLPFDLSRLQQCSKDSGHGNLAYGFKDECERLCIEADIFMAKSVERENVGDLSMAALLSDTAAAKARAAMDAPYSNTQSLALAKLKHSMCVIRSSNLHKKLKEAEAAQRRKQKESTSNGHHSHLSSHNNGAFNHSNSKDNLDKSHDNGHNESNKSTGSGKLMEMDGYESSGKSIEIYATLPKKSLKKKGALLSFMESLTGEDNSNDKNSKQKISGTNDENCTESSISSQTENASLNTSSHSQQKSKTSNDASCLKSPGSRKKDRNTQKINRDSDLSDYSSEWEHTKKSSLYRTYSGPPTDSKGEFGDITKESLNQTFSGHPTKKQHRIRRKLMGGFMRRKNRSLPDLREGQDQVSSVSRSFDDCAISQTPVLIRKLGEQEQKEIKNISLAPKTMHPSKQMLIAGNFINKPVYDNSYHDEKHNLIMHGRTIGQASKASPQKHTLRTHTPPPYKPPPPIASGGTNSDLTPKRMLSHIEEPYKQVSQSQNLALKTTVTEQQGKQYSMLERTANQQSPANENRDSFSVTIKSNPPNVKINYDNALPKGTAVWLKELQMKQEEIIHKRKLQEKWEKQQSENMQKPQFKIVNPHREVDNNQMNQLCMQLPVGEGDIILQGEFKKGHHAYSKCDQEENDVFHTETPEVSDKQTNEDNSTQEASIHSKSVKDLASRFEKILKPCLQSTEACQASTETFTLQQNAEKIVSLSSPSVHTEASISPIDMHDIELTVQKDNKSNSKETLISDSPRTHYSASSASGCIYNPHLTEGQLTNMLRIGANRAAFRNSNSALLSVKEYGSAIKMNPSAHTCEFVARSDMRRPDKPPDYETAIQRLELIRGDRNLINYISNNYFVNSEASLSFLEQSKKKRGPKKSVTFSDKVVLVACAGDEDNDFIPNPLLERVYKQHLMQKSSMELPTEAKSGEVQHIPQCVQKDCHNGQHGATVMPNSSTLSSAPKHFTSSQSPCHLCHKKTVTAPTVYCPDCAFYMSRFQPNKQ